MLGLIAKAIIASAAAAAASIITALSDGTITGPEGITAGVAFLVALGGVWLIPNLPGPVAIYGKAITAGLIAAAGSFSAVLVDTGWPLSLAQWLTVAGAAVVGSGLVGIAPNAARSDYTKAA